MYDNKRQQERKNIYWTKVYKGWQRRKYFLNDSMKPILPRKNKDIERREKYITIHLKNTDTKHPQLNISNVPYTS